MGYRPANQSSVGTVFLHLRDERGPHHDRSVEMNKERTTCSKNWPEMSCDLSRDPDVIDVRSSERG